MITENEKELLNKLVQIEDILENIKNNVGNISVSTNTVQYLNELLESVKTTYPGAKTASHLCDGCGSDILKFLESLIPIYDRLKRNDDVEDEILENVEIIKEVLKMPEGTHLVEVKEVKKVGRKKKI